MPGKIFFTVCFWLILLSVTTDAGGPESLVEQIKTGGHVLMIRHAVAPGTGDPDNFRISDCSTQRNLSDQGRGQARHIGQWLRLRGIGSSRVYSSQWCRCLETARLLDLGPVVELPALNSFFQRLQDREPNLAALRAFISEQPADGALIVLVAHSVTITGITGKSVSSGEGAVIRLKGDGGFEVLGRLGFDF